jgi:hypothetical protein
LRQRRAPDRSLTGRQIERTFLTATRQGCDPAKDKGKPHAAAAD